MKMDKNDFNYLLQMIERILRKVPTIGEDYSNGRFVRSEKVKDLNKRFRWDLFRASTTVSFRSALYDYLNDTHIDTALRRIVKPIERTY